MEKFVLRPARIRGTKVVVDKVLPVKEVSWPELVELVGGSRSAGALLTLRRLRRGSYVGVRARNGAHTNFLFEPVGTSKSSIAWILNQEPAFEAQVVQLWYVEQAVYESKVLEAQAS